MPRAKDLDNSADSIIESGSAKRTAFFSPGILQNTNDFSYPEIISSDAFEQKHTRAALFQLQTRITKCCQPHPRIVHCANFNCSLHGNHSSREAQIVQGTALLSPAV
jgi:hypothetical protein